MKLSDIRDLFAKALGRAPEPAAPAWRKATHGHATRTARRTLGRPWTYSRPPRR